MSVYHMSYVYMSNFYVFWLKFRALLWKEIMNDAETAPYYASLLLNVWELIGLYSNVYIYSWLQLYLNRQIDLQIFHGLERKNVGYSNKRCHPENFSKSFPGWWYMV